MIELVKDAPTYKIGQGVIVTALDGQRFEAEIVEPEKPLGESQIAVRIEHSGNNIQIYNVELRQVRPI